MYSFRARTRRSASLANDLVGQVSPWPCGGNEVRQSRPFSKSRASFLVAAAPRCERCRLSGAEFRRRFAMARPFRLTGRAVARRAKAASGYVGQFRCFLGSLKRNQNPKLCRWHAKGHEIWAGSSAPGKRLLQFQINANPERRSRAPARARERGCLALRAVEPFRRRSPTHRARARRRARARFP